jgi:integrase
LIGRGVDANIGKELRYEGIRKDLLDRYETRGFRSLKHKLNEETGKKEPTVWGVIHLDQFFAGWKVSAITQASIRSHLPEKLWPLLTPLYYTGVRIGEAIKIMWSYDGLPQIDLEKRQITLLGVRTKNGQPRVLPWTDGLVDMLQRRSQADGPVFDSTNFRKEFAVAKAKVKCPHVLIHDFRRSAVSSLVNAGVSETGTMEISGHRSLTVFDRCHVRNTKRLHDAISKVEKSHSLVAVEKKWSHKSLKARSSVG